MIDFSDDAAVHKLARLIWRLEEWSVTHKLYRSAAHTYEQTFWATYEILGLSDYVSQGHRMVRTSRLVYCAGCGTTHMLPIKTEVLMVGCCTLCENEWNSNDFRDTTPLYPVRMLLAALPPQVEEAVYGRLADSYFMQLGK